MLKDEVEASRAAARAAAEAAAAAATAATMPVTPRANGSGTPRASQIPGPGGVTSPRTADASTRNLVSLLEDARKDLGKERARRDAAERSLAERAAELQALRSDLDGVKEKLGATVKEATRGRRDTEAAAREVHELRGEIAAVRAASDAAERARRAAKDEAEASSREVARLKRELAAAVRRADGGGAAATPPPAVPADAAAEIARLKSDLKAEEAARAEALAEVKRLGGELRSLRGECQKFETQAAAQRESAAATAGRLGSRVKELERELEVAHAAGKAAADLDRRRLSELAAMAAECQKASELQTRAEADAKEMTGKLREERKRAHQLDSEVKALKRALARQEAATRELAGLDAMQGGVDGQAVNSKPEGVVTAARHAEALRHAEGEAARQRERAEGLEAQLRGGADVQAKLRSRIGTLENVLVSRGIALPPRRQNTGMDIDPESTGANEVVVSALETELARARSALASHEKAIAQAEGKIEELSRRCVAAEQARETSARATRRQSAAAELEAERLRTALEEKEKAHRERENELLTQVRKLKDRVAAARGDGGATPVNGGPETPAVTPRE
ncbi:unnamed protein product [Pedinophyceae sp. YPF-701]|nr:unnamed protein product [Pedinophyceae sp. YPF-701]